MKGKSENLLHLFIVVVVVFSFLLDPHSSFSQWAIFNSVLIFVFFSLGLSSRLGGKHRCLSVLKTFLLKEASCCIYVAL